VAGLERRAEAGWETGAKPKLLKRILDLIQKEIPADPTAPTFEQGNTLGADARGWRRAKFLGRFRLFFRFDSASKVIVYAWVNDENTLRKSGAATDPYAVFRGMLLSQDPPTNWKNLLDA
jgi:toxin YhaV